MPKLVEQLNKSKMTLMVELPHNTLELAQAAIKGGANALQLQIDKGIKEEKKNLIEILEGCKLPVGLSVSPKKHLTQKETNEMVKMGFDFLSLGIEHLSPPLLGVKGFSKIVTLNSRYALDEVVELSQSKFEALDAAIIPSSEQGKGLEVGDLQNYISLILSSGMPVIIPTQRNLHPSEVAIIADTGAKGILLTRVVTGTTAKHIEEATRKFRVAVDDLA